MALDIPREALLHMPRENNTNLRQHTYLRQNMETLSEHVRTSESIIRFFYVRKFLAQRINRNVGAQMHKGR